MDSTCETMLETYISCRLRFLEISLTSQDEADSDYPKHLRVYSLCIETQHIWSMTGAHRALSFPGPKSKNTTGFSRKALPPPPPPPLRRELIYCSDISSSCNQCARALHAKRVPKKMWIILSGPSSFFFWQAGRNSLEQFWWRQFPK